MTAVVLATIGGALAGSVWACLPGLHVYNLLGLLAAACWTGGVSATIPDEAILAAAVSLVTSFAIVGAIPSVFLAAPDESALFTVLPGQRYLMEGRGYEAVVLMALGGVAGLGILLVAVGWAGGAWLPMVHAVLGRHGHWILWSVVAFMLLSEWPKGGRLGQGGWRRFADAWRSPAAGLLTFFLSGLLGFVLFFRSPLAPGAGFANLMPVFVGLFTVPWMILNAAFRVRVPPQRLFLSAAPRRGLPWRGVAAGVAGGGFAAFFPIVSGGVGGLLAGHALSVRDDRTFLASQGASRAVYYVGGLLLLFVPGRELVRGGGAWLLKSVYEGRGLEPMAVACGAAALSAAVALAMVTPLCRHVIRWQAAWGPVRLAAGGLGIAVSLVAATTGWAGLGVMAVAASVGLIPPLFGSRRMNALGVILIPMGCQLSGTADRVAAWLGLGS